MLHSLVPGPPTGNTVYVPPSWLAEVYKVDKGPTTAKSLWRSSLQCQPPTTCLPAPCKSQVTGHLLLLWPLTSSLSKGSMPSYPPCYLGGMLRSSLPLHDERPTFPPPAAERGRMRDSASLAGFPQLCHSCWEWGRGSCSRGEAEQLASLGITPSWQALLKQLGWRKLAGQGFKPRGAFLAQRLQG